MQPAIPAPEIRPPDVARADDVVAIMICLVAKEMTMKRLGVVAVGWFLSIATGADAAEFYIVQDTATKKCQIVDRRVLIEEGPSVSGLR